MSKIRCLLLVPPLCGNLTKKQWFSCCILGQPLHCISKAPRAWKTMLGFFNQQMLVEWLKREDLQPISFQLLQVYEKQFFINKCLGKKAAKTDFPQLLSEMLVGQCTKSRSIINPVDIGAHLCSRFWLSWGSQTIWVIFTLWGYKPLGKRRQLEMTAEE